MSEIEEFCIENEEFCIENDEFCRDSEQGLRNAERHKGLPQYYFVGAARKNNLELAVNLRKKAAGEII